MAIDFADYQALIRKQQGERIEPVIKTIDPDEAWVAMEGWLNERILATTKHRDDLLRTYNVAEIGPYEQMVRAKCLLDITSVQLLCYEEMLKAMQGYHAAHA